MHATSFEILLALSEGREVLGFNGALFSSSFRAAFGEGANALALVRQIHAMTGDESRGEALPTPATGSTQQSAVESHTPLAEAPPVSTSPAQVDVELSRPSADESTETARPEESTPAQESSARCEALPSDAPVPASPAIVTAVDVPAMPPQSDEPDEQGWRPSEDNMLVDEYEGLGLSLAEIAQNHGRAESSIESRLVRLGKLKAASSTQAVSAPSQAEHRSDEGSVLAPAERQAPEPGTPAFEAVIEAELKHISGTGVAFVTGVLRYMERSPQQISKLVPYLNTPKAQTLLNDKLRRALIEKVNHAMTARTRQR